MIVYYFQLVYMFRESTQWQSWLLVGLKGNGWEGLILIVLSKNQISLIHFFLCSLLLLLILAHRNKEIKKQNHSLMFHVPSGWEWSWFSTTSLLFVFSNTCCFMIAHLTKDDCNEKVLYWTISAFSFFSLFCYNSIWAHSEDLTLKYGHIFWYVTVSLLFKQKKYTSLSGKQDYYWNKYKLFDICNWC